MPLQPGVRLGPYEIVAPLGAGGMGEVYRARHLRLERDVAIKVLPADLASDPERRHRLEREARAASALNHPHIVTIHDIDEHDGQLYIAMELVEGRSLREALRAGAWPLGEVLALARQMADGLARAHGAGIVHRDLKPENVMVTGDGLVKIVDFGLAKALPGAKDREATTVSAITRQGVITGTVEYLSPEQVAGQPADDRSDQFAFGVVLYELLCGRRPFAGDSLATVLGAIVRDAPPAPHTLRPEVTKELDAIVMRCLEKDPARRHPSMADVAEAIGRYQGRLAAAAASRGLFRRPVVVALAVALVAVVAVAGWLWVRFADERWARQALPEITRLTEEGNLYDAYQLALQASRRVPGDAAVQELIDRITLPIAVATEPAGALVEVKSYRDPDGTWQRLGETPIDVRVPYALMHWKITKAGFETFEGAPFGTGPIGWLGSGIPLQPEGTCPEGTVWVPGGPVVTDITAGTRLPSATLPDYWLDRFEVTNRQYKSFVDQGGYSRREFWTEPFADAGGVASWEDATARFRDLTGRPGPAGWELGAYPAGHDADPVGGLSWHEAAAYCAFAGKSLPTVFHWYNATHQDQLSDIVSLSNFGSDGPVPVGSLGGLGDYGTYDMAGNVKEWCSNPTETGGKRYILGGGWGEPSYQFRLPDARQPFERLPTHGVRCARYSSPPDPAVSAPLDITSQPPDRQPVGDDVFEAYLSFYAYDRPPLDAKVERTDDSQPHWRKETVSFTAGYGGERVTALLFLPRNAAPPYQAVIWYPGSDAQLVQSSETLASAYLFDFIPRDGRALVYPIYKGLYERRLPPDVPFRLRDRVPASYKDFARTLDYLETRADFDPDRVAYYGFSLAWTGPILAALEPRIKTCVLLAGGIPRYTVPPYIDPVNFAPRSRAPTLMINGRDDFMDPLETSQRPLFRLLGAPEADKRHVLLDGGHLPPDRRAIIREVLAWLDRYLGPVSPPAARPTSSAAR